MMTLGLMLFSTRRAASGSATLAVTLAAATLSAAGTVTPVPAITGVNYQQGDPLGGGASIVITGTGLGSASSVLFGATSASITGNTSTTVTVTLPAHASGSANITVTTAGGTSNAWSFDYWYPGDVASCTLLAEKPDYAVSAGTGTWTARIGGNPSEATVEPSATAGAPVFAGAQRLLTASTIGNYLDMVAASAGSSAIVINASAAAAASSPIENGVCLWAENVRGGIGAAFSSTYGLTAWLTDGSYMYAHRAMAADGNPHIAMTRFSDGTSVGAKVDGSLWSETSIGTYAADTANAINIGQGYSSGFLNNATMLVAAFFSTKISDSDATKLYNWAQQRHGVA